MKTPTKLTKKQQREIIKLYEQAYGYRTISEMLELGSGVVYGFLTRNGLVDSYRKGFTWKIRQHKKQQIRSAKSGLKS